MFWHRLAFLIAAAFALAASAAAEPVQPARVEAAERLLVAVGFDSMMDKMADQLTEQMKTTLPAQINARLDKPLPDDLMQRILGITDAHMRKSFAANRADLRRGTALIYASHFTESELDRLVQLQADPVMRKFQAEVPELMAQALTLGQGLAERNRSQLESAIKAEVEEYFRSRGQAAPTISELERPRHSARS